jgi:rhamnose utilization protein RhaD (predicted bifunctional aldolase and dehydrogenase)
LVVPVFLSQRFHEGPFFQKPAHPNQGKIEAQARPQKTVRGIEDKSDGDNLDSHAEQEGVANVVVQAFANHPVFVPDFDIRTEKTAQILHGGFAQRQSRKIESSSDEKYRNVKRSASSPSFTNAEE